MSAPAFALKPTLPELAPLARRKIDLWMLAGIIVALGAVAAGIALAGIRMRYFLQPTSVLIVLGGTLGVTFITTPRHALVRAMRGAVDLLWVPEEDRAALLEELVSLSKNMRPKGILGVEVMIDEASRPFLRETLRLAVDSRNRTELTAMLEIKLRQFERQGETDARAFDVAGGFAPTIGVLGTVVGLMDVLRQFSNMASVASGTGTAFVSTIYGLALANLILLPSAQRMRAHTAEQSETNEMIIEGALCLFDGLHPALVRDRLTCFLHREDRI